MNRQECQKLIDSYVDWLRQGLHVEEVGGASELTRPFRDRHNDHLQVFATRRNGNIILSDDGYILPDMTVGRTAVARGEKPLYALDTVVCLRRGSSDVQAQPDEIISLVTQFAF